MQASVYGTDHPKTFTFSGSGMRLYFDLRNDQDTLRDVEGLQVADLAQARRVASEMIQELRQEDPSLAQEWSGWTLHVTDTAGRVLFTLDLDSRVP